MIQKIEINVNGVPYTLNVDAAVKAGALLPAYPLTHGDVYYDPTGNTNRLLLVQVSYISHCERERTDIMAFVLLGIGLSPNSGKFFDKLHTKQEISDFLTGHKMRFLRNINVDVRNLVSQNG